MVRRSVEGAIVSALQELGKVFGEKRVMNAAGSVLQTAAQTKAAVDDNVSTVLGLAGLPSRADIDALRRQMDVMQATLANLSRKVDRLLEEAERASRQAHADAAEVPRTRRRARPTTL
jgi:outer membrane murein-binding lipoprotein Lpp